MVKFSCFPTHIHYHRSKKAGEQHSGEKHAKEMHKNGPELSQHRVLMASPGSTGSNFHASAEQITSPSFECCWKSDNATSYPKDENEVLQSMQLKKSKSLGSGLDREGGCSCDVDTEDEIDHRLSLNNSHDKNIGGVFVSFDNSGLPVLCHHDCPGMDLLNQNREDVNAESFKMIADGAAPESIFSIGDPEQYDNDLYEVNGEQLSSDHVAESGHFILNTPLIFAKSHSLPSLRGSSKLSERSPGHKLMGPRSRSCEDLCAIDTRTEFSNAGEGSRYHNGRLMSFCHNMSEISDIVEKRVCQESLGEECILSNRIDEFKEMADPDECLKRGNDNHKCDNQLSDGYDHQDFNILANDRRESEKDGVDIRNSQTESSLVKGSDELDSKEFNIKRIKEWIHQIDIQDSSPVQELGESSSSHPKTKKTKKESHLSGVDNTKPDARGSPGVEAAYSYISSMTPASTSAQMANLGLVVIPSLSAFSSVRVLNLSCNSIVRITSGALPRGLHMLNLSKNNISTIEGLRELTRLRVLDLSYNRIFKIGHGLASCSSLKELYLAGNKISEVEGLHRLLKLHVLDLRFNKISTAKCLGQLAANYVSLQSINLEGNPAQRNEGDEHLRRYLFGLLPHIVYFNGHIIKASSKKNSAASVGSCM